MGIFGNRLFGTGESITGASAPGFWDKLKGKKPTPDANFKAEPEPQPVLPASSPEPEPQPNMPGLEPLEPKRRFNLLKRVSSVVSGAAGYFRSAERGMTRLNIGAVNVEPQSQAVQPEPSVSLPEPDIVLNPGAAEQLNTQEAKKEVAQRVEKKTKGVDWKSIGLGTAFGLAARRTAEAYFGVQTLAIKGAVGAVTGGVSAGIKEYRKQKIENNEKANELIEKFIDSQVNKSKPVLGEEPPASLLELEALQRKQDAEAKIYSESLELASKLMEKKRSGQKLTVKDWKEFLKVDPHLVQDQGKISDTELALRGQINQELENLKTNKREMVKSIAIGAASGAFAATVLGEALHYAYEHNFLNVNSAVHSALDYAGKYFGGAKEAVSTVSPELHIYNPAYHPVVTEHLQQAAEKVTYSFTDSKIQSLTEISRRVLHDYLENSSVNPNDTLHNLSRGQLVYAEDFLRKSLEKAGQLPGTNARVKGELIAKALKAAQALSNEKVQNLDSMLQKPAYSLSKAAKDLMDSDKFTNIKNISWLKKAFIDKGVNLPGFVLKGPDIANALAH